MKRILSYIYLLLFLFCLNIGVKAIDYARPIPLASSNISFTSVTVGQSGSNTGDLITVNTRGYVSQYCINTVNATSSMKCYSSTKNTFYFSVRNGTYYLWIRGTGTDTGSLTAVSYGSVTVNDSCTNQATVENSTGSGEVQRCFVAKSGTQNSPELDLTSNPVVRCASGYSPTYGIKENKCNNGLSMTINGQTISERYCRVIFSYSCTKDGSGCQEGFTWNGSACVKNDSSGGGGGGSTVAAATLSSLSVSSGSLSPSFKSGTKSYSVSVASGVSSITISATAASGCTIVSGVGSTNLSYGANTKYVVVKNSAGKKVTYTLNITRQDDRSADNTLSKLTVSSGTLSPEFNAATTTYAVEVLSSVTELTIGAELTDSKASFVDGFGPRPVELQTGMNSVLIKVRSENGNVNTYTLNVTKDDLPEECRTNPDNVALLKDIEISSAYSDVTIESINFEPNTKNYDLTVPYEVQGLKIQAYVKEEGDVVEVEGGDNLEVGEENKSSVTITVTSKNCSGMTTQYTINVIRDEEKLCINDPGLKSLTVKNHSEIEFASDKTEYSITLSKGETSISEDDFNYSVIDESTECIITDNKNLSKNSVVLLTCTACDGTTQAIYQFKVTNVEKGISTFWIIVLIIIIILVIVWLVLRLLGYKIYFNLGVVGAFFRGIGEKIKNMFDK